MESTELIPMDGDVAKIQRRAEEFRDLPEALQRNLQVFLTLIMDILASAHQKAKSSLMTEATRQVVGALVRRTHDNLADVRSADPRFAAQEVAVAHDFRGHAEVSAVPGRVFVSSTVGRRDRPLKLKWFCSSLPCQRLYISTYLQCPIRESIWMKCIIKKGTPGLARSFEGV